MCLFAQLSNCTASSKRARVLREIIISFLSLHQVLEVEFYNVKALYRRAQAYIETKDFLLADLDIKKALEADPENRY